MSVKRLFETFKPENYKIFLDLSGAKNRDFSGKVEILGRAEKSSEISLHSKDLAISKVIFAGESLKFEHREEDELVIFAGEKSFEAGENITLEIEFSGKITDAMHGLYPCYYDENGEKKELFATQFESHHAREVFPCVDEPEAKATFELELKADQNFEVISNTKPVETRDYGEFLTKKFAKTPKMSTYLLAFAVGDFQKKTAKTKSGVEVSTWATKAQSSELLDFPLDIAVRVLEFYEDYFDEKFPLEKCDHVALPDFSSGAMENWGLITYRETAMLAGEKSAISAKKYVALVIAHETAHQWFGNLVTMKWWDDLWLNESFATMMEYFSVDSIEPKWNIWEEFAVNEAVLSLRRDAIDGVQAVHVPVHHPDEISTIFDGAIVYAKGARLMNMLRKFVGDTAFRDGLRAYFKRFKYQNTVGADLWACLSEASGKNVAEFMEPWISKSGYPAVRAEKSGEKICLHQKQFFVGEGEEKGKTWPILLGANLETLPEIMNEKQIEADFSGDFLKLNDGNVAHFIANYSPELFEKLLSKIENLDTISRLQILQERSLLARGGQVSSTDLLKTLQFYAGENALNVWDMMNILIGDLKIFVDENSQAESRMKIFIENLAKNQFEKLGFSPKNGESEDETQLRSSILGHMVYAENPEVVARALEIFAENESDLSKIDAEIRALVLLVKIREQESPELIEKFIELYRTTPNVDFRDDLLVALTSTKNSETVKFLLEKMKDSQTVRSQDLVSWYVHLLRNSRGRGLTWAWCRQNWAWVCETFDGDKSYSDFPRYSGAILRTEEHLAEFVEFFGEMKSEPSLARAIEMGEREIRARVELISRDKVEFEQVLAEISEK